MGIINIWLRFFLVMKLNIISVVYLTFSIGLRCSANKTFLNTSDSQVKEKYC
jgi:hypothetical protein